MNFKEWYNSTLANHHTSDRLQAAEHGWDACKKEILSIIEDNREYLSSNKPIAFQKMFNKIRDL